MPTVLNFAAWNESTSANYNETTFGNSAINKTTFLNSVNKTIFENSISEDIESE